MKKDELVGKIRYHWHSYIARGGFDTPKLHPGRLQKGGIEHWNKVLQLGRVFVSTYPYEIYMIEAFIPGGIIKLLTGAI
jgi:hypothetical protein